MPISLPVSKTIISSSGWGIPITNEVNRLTPLVDAAAKGLVYHHESPDASQPTTSTNMVVPGFPGPNVNMKANRAYLVTAHLSLIVNPGPANYCQFWIRAVRSGSDVISPSAMVYGSNLMAFLTLPWIYTLTVDAAVALSLYFGVYFGGGTAQIRNDLVKPKLMVQDIGPYIAPV